MVVIGILKIVGGKVVIRCKWRFIDFDKRIVGVVVYKKKRFIKYFIVLFVIYIYKKIKESFKLYKYNLFINNCEYFVIFCVIG